MGVVAALLLVTTFGFVWMWVTANRANRRAEEAQRLLDEEAGARTQNRILWGKVKDEALLALKAAGVAEAERDRVAAINLKLVEESARLNVERECAAQEVKRLRAACDQWGKNHAEACDATKIAEHNYQALLIDYGVRGEEIKMLKAERDIACNERDRLAEKNERLVRERDELHASLLGLRRDVVDRVSATIGGAQIIPRGV